MYDAFIANMCSTEALCVCVTAFVIVCTALWMARPREKSNNTAEEERRHDGSRILQTIKSELPRNVQALIFEFDSTFRGHYDRVMVTMQMGFKVPQLKHLTSNCL